jgi:hypothetical protein
MTALARPDCRSFKRAALVGAACVAILLFTPSLAFATDYYVSPTGADARSGTSPDAAWQTIQRVNNQRLAAGDRVLFEGGQTFSGNLYLDGGESGSAAAPVVIGSYGTGRATIYAGDGTGILVLNASGIVVRDLYIVGSGSTTNAGSGIFFYVDLPGGVKLPYVRVDSVDAVRFGEAGVLVGSNGDNSGFEDVRITRVIASDNRKQGIFVYSQTPNSHRNVYVGDCRAFRNSGQTGLPFNSGNGITLSGVDLGVIERSVAHDNGWLSDAANGPIGIWTYQSNNVVIQYNESYANKTGGTKDGGGFSLDNSTSNSVLQYNYTHDNTGAGLQLAHKPDDAVHSGNVIRYNISQNDGRKNAYAAIQLWGRIRNAEIYNNTVFVTYTGPARGVYIKNSSIETQDVQHVHIRNNIIITTNTTRLVEVTPTQLDGAIDLRFENNAYFSTSATPRYTWGTVTYTSLAAWRTATGQETIGSTPVGFEGDPMLKSAGFAPTIDDAAAIDRIEAYRLRPGSRAIDGGLNLSSLFGVSTGTHDYYGGATPQGGAYDIGAHEFASDCSWTVSPSTLAFTADGGTMAAAVDASAASCGWTARANNEWVYVVAPANGVGDGFVGIGATPNPLATARSGSATIGLQQIVVTQPAGAASANQPPSVTLTDPSNGAAFPAGADITVAATAADADGTVTSVDFLANGVLLGSGASSPYSLVWPHVAAGTYTVVARATDNGGAVSNSTAATVFVGDPSSGLPVPWNTADIGSVGVAGSASYNGGVFTSSGSGTDIWGTADAFRYVYQTLTGDGEIVARVATVSNADVWTKAGVMIRATLDAGSPQASMFVSSGKGLALQYRTLNSGTSASIAGGAGTAPVWVRLVRAGTSLAAYRSGDGVAWTRVGAITISMPATVYVGLALTSHNNGALADATYDNVVVTTSAPTWQHRDIGSVALSGSFSESGGTFTVQGAGADIWGTADAFHFVYQPLSGDGQIVARIVGVDRTHDWAKAGVMIRETLAAGSRHASVFVSAARGVAFQRRTANGGTSVSTAGSLSAAPRWVKATRIGSTFAAYESADGVSWTLVGTETISMSVDVFVGIAVTSHNTTALCTATADAVAR